MDIDTVNSMSKPQFVATFGDIAEHSPWVAEEAFASGPFADLEALIAAFENAMQGAPKDAQLALIRAHPDLAGKAALAGELAKNSRNEQAGAGLDTLTQLEFERFTRLNNRYRDTFGFPFIFAVKGSTKFMILDAFEQRIDNSLEVEFETAVLQVTRIFRFRLESLVVKRSYF